MVRKTRKIKCSDCAKEMNGSDYDWYMATKERKCCSCTVKQLDKQGKETEKLGKEFDEVLAKFK